MFWDPIETRRPRIHQGHRQHFYQWILGAYQLLEPPAWSGDEFLACMNNKVHCTISNKLFSLKTQCKKNVPENQISGISFWTLFPAKFEKVLTHTYRAWFGPKSQNHWFQKRNRWVDLKILSWKVSFCGFKESQERILQLDHFCSHWSIKLPMKFFAPIMRYSRILRGLIKVSLISPLFSDPALFSQNMGEIIRVIIISKE